jgi:hypothetical protein
MHRDREDPSRVTVAFSSHRPETLTFAADWMRRHDVVVLEEPRHENFAAMLEGRVSIDDYLDDVEFEFPVFARRSCELHRQLHTAGKTILQVDPFMERLGRIHDRFAAGETPAQVGADGRYSEVYDAEREWTAALLGYYESAARADFDTVVAALQAFSRADAARGKVRDRLRAEELERFLPVDRSVYIEAGEIHIGLVDELRSRLEPSRPVSSTHLMEPILKRLTGKGRYPGPGDALTMLLTKSPDFSGAQADLLAARALVHVKILHKEEITGEEGEFPHTRDEIECNRLVEDLSYDDCRKWFAQIRFMPAGEARAAISTGSPGRA